MPKSTKYSLVWTGGSLELATDPRGWQEDAVAFSRDENHGINVQNVVALSFSGAARDKIKEFYDTYGAYAKMSVSIDKRNNLWELNSWYQYRLDFKTYKETKSFVEISGIEEGLLSSVQKFADTEYKVQIPTEKNFLNYTGTTVYKKNQIQALFGSIGEKEGIEEDAYVLGGKRAVRTYSNAISFTNSSGEPYETMTLRATSATTFDLKINLKLKVIAKAFLRNPLSGKLKIYKHDANFSSPVLVAQYSPLGTYIANFKRYDTFSWITTISNISLSLGQMISIFYVGDGGAYSSISVEDAQGAYVEIGGFSQSQYQDTQLEVFDFEWATNEVLKIIYPNVEFESHLSYNDFQLALSATPCIYNMGSTAGTGTLKIKLSDVLKSINCLKMIGIDIQLDKFTIYPLQSLYNPTATINTIEAKDIVVEHDSTHQYKKIKVGSPVNERGEDSDMVYPFIVEKGFEVTDCEFDAELDLVNPFMVDPYDVDNYIKDTLGNEKSTDKCDFVVFAVLPVTSTEHSAGGATDTEEIDNPNSQTKQVQVGVSHNIPSNLMKYDAKIKVGTTADIFDDFTPISFTINVYEQGILSQSFTGSGTPTQTYTTTNEIPSNTNVDVEYIQDYEVAEFALTQTLTVSVEAFFVYSEAKEIGKELYKNHTIISGLDPSAVGSESSLYNIPLTPKRILQTWDSYLKISVFGNATGKYKFLTSKHKNTALVTKCHFESSNVVEEADFTPISTTPIFQPKICTFTAAKKYEGDTVFIPKKYERYRVVDSKRGVTYTGWIKDFTFGLNKAKEQDYVLQIQSIT